MRQTGTIVLIIGVAGLVFFGVKTIIDATVAHSVDVSSAPFTEGLVPLILSLLLILVSILMFISAGKKIKK